MDKLFLLKSEFQDPQFPGRRFYCWHCALLEGLLSTYPHHLEKLDVIRVKWPRPRAEVISEVGADNQALPLLVLADGKKSKYQTGVWQNRRFISDKDNILRYLSEKYGIPEAHP